MGAGNKGNARRRGRQSSAITTSGAIESTASLDASVAVDREGMASDLAAQVRNIAEVTIAVARGDLSKKIAADVRCEILQLKEAINAMVDQLRSFELRVAESTSELAAANARLVESERGRSLALAAGSMGSWRYEFARNRWHWDEGQARIFGLRAESGGLQPRTQDLRSFFSEPEWKRMGEAANGASPANNTFQTEITILRLDGELRHCLIAAAATFGEDGKLSCINGVTIDITGRKEAEQRQGLLAREVDHRTRNALAVVQAVIHLTREEQSTQAFREAVEGRVRALAKAHDLLSQSRWQGGDILRLVREELAPYFPGASRVQVEGPSVALQPDRAQTISLVLHELATNAAKYGALSETSGSVKVRWQLNNGMLDLDWLEDTSRHVSPPTRNGVGTRIINAFAATMRGGGANFDWRPNGLAFRLSMPLGTRELSRPGTSAANKNVVRLALARRVLLVEDEPLTGMFVRDLLVELGYHVVGPIGSIEEAMEFAQKEEFCAALLDVNLRGRPVDPVAALLMARQIPIAMVTGYAGEHIGAAFAQVPLLRKPVAPDAVRDLLSQMARVEHPSERLDTLRA
jgi:two-component sensor histidine kinase